MSRWRRQSNGGIRFEIPSDNAVERLIRGRLPLGLGAPDAVREVCRDVYYDTPEAVLFRRGIQCRRRYAADGRQVLTVRWEAGPGTTGRREDLDLTGLDADRLFVGTSGAAGLLRAVIDPARLAPVLEIQTDRHIRTARWFGWPSPCCRLTIDRRKILGGDRSVDIADLEVTPLAGPGPSRSLLASALMRRHGLHPTLTGVLQRAREALESGEAAALTSSLHSPRECAVLLVRSGEIGLRRCGDHLGVFWMPGSGESASREVLEQAFGSSQAQVRCLGQVAARPWRRPLEVWMARRLPETVASDPSVEWIALARAVELAGTPLLRDTRALSALHVASRSDVMKEHTHGVRPARRPARRPVPPPRGSNDDGRFLDADISQLDFNARVLELAADSTIAVGDRLNYLAIAASNLDEFVMVRVAALKREVLRGTGGDASAVDTPSSRLDAVRLRSRALSQQMSDGLAQSLLPELARRGVRVRAWTDLDQDERSRLSRRFHEDVRPRLVPLALTASHPFPHIANIELALAVMLRHPDTGHTHYATLSLPPSLPRFLALETPGEWIAMESLLCAHGDSLFPGVDILQAHVFRVTRSADVAYGDAESTDRLQEVVDAIDRRPFQPVVRLEVERHMPPEMRALLLQEFRFELPDRVSDLEDGDVVDIEGLIALRGLSDIAAGVSCRLPVRARAPFTDTASVFETLRAGDVLAHFPYDSFEASVLRFLHEASDDADVETITLTLYRTSADSALLDALYRARAAGKTVVALVELKARFDEARNIETARGLRAAGIHVVYGVADMKLHSKFVLVLRREPDGLRRYAFVGSGNLNPVTAGLYTDVGLFTARDGLGEELAALADSLTGSASHAPFRELLVSPATMLPRLLGLIRREISHATSGRPAGIRVKLNGLDDTELIDALYAASRAGVRVDLSVRGICRLRPGMPGLSDRIQVVSVLGEFLEHARIVEFANGGAPEYFIGSADWRERNLRKRVELMAPVVDPAGQRRLARVLDLDFGDPGAWHLAWDGTWSRRGGSNQPASSQRQLLRDLVPATPVSPHPDPDPGRDRGSTLTAA